MRQFTLLKPFKYKNKTETYKCLNDIYKIILLITSKAKEHKNCPAQPSSSATLKLNKKNSPSGEIIFKGQGNVDGAGGIMLSEVTQRKRDFEKRQKSPLSYGYEETNVLRKNKQLKTTTALEYQLPESASQSGEYVDRR